MGNNASKSRLTNQERSLNRTKLISNFVEKNNNLDSLNITEFHNNENKVKIPLQLIPVSSLNKVGGGVVKQNNAFNEQMIKHEIFNLLHDTEIQQYHYNNMKASGILNTDNHVITGGAVANEPAPAPASVNSDVSDAMNRIKQVIMAELGTQQGGAINTSNSASDSDSNTNGCGCGSENEKGYKHKCGNGSNNENGKKGKKGSKKGKSGKKGGKKGEKGENDGSSSSTDSSDSVSSSSSSSSHGTDRANGLKNSGKGLSIFPFNSSDVQSSEKNFRLMRRKI